MAFMGICRHPICCKCVVKIEIGLFIAISNDFLRCPPHQPEATPHVCTLLGQTLDLTQIIPVNLL